jgi:hypothetical protein
MSPLEPVMVAVGLVNLAVTLALVRRVREHSEQLKLVAGLAPGSISPGDAVAAFTTTTIDGRSADREDLADGGLIAVLSPGCGACEDAVAGLKQYLARPARSPALVILAGDPTTAAPMAEQLRAHAPVVVEAEVQGTVQRALGIREYPSLVGIAAGRVTGVGHNIVDLPSVLATLPGSAR